MSYRFFFDNDLLLYLWWLLLIIKLVVELVISLIFVSLLDLSLCNLYFISCSCEFLVPKGENWKSLAFLILRLTSLLVIILEFLALCGLLKDLYFSSDWLCPLLPLLLLVFLSTAELSLLSRAVVLLPLEEFLREFWEALRFFYLVERLAVSETLRLGLLEDRMTELKVEVILSNSYMVYSLERFTKFLFLKATKDYYYLLSLLRLLLLLTFCFLTKL